jgi:hypothetical protein
MEKMVKREEEGGRCEERKEGKDKKEGKIRDHKAKVRVVG